MLTATPARVAIDPDFAAIRAREFSRLDAQRHAYLDYTGSALYGEQQLRAQQTLLADGIYGNPHSDNATSRASTALLDEARRAVLRFVDADPAAYSVIFTANTSAAIKLVAESYPFGTGGAFVLTADNHNSVNGVREYARRAGAAVHYVGLDASLRLRNAIGVLDAATSPADAASAGTHAPARLFAYPPQSNFSGVKHPLALVAAAHARGYDVLLDAAAFVPTSRLSLRDVPADFVAMSFYKVFGYPTGVGALVARHDAMRKLSRPWFAGGTVEYASIQNDTHRLRAHGEGFEDGTPNFLGVAAVPAGFTLIDEVGVDRIGAHVHALTATLLTALQTPAHANGRPIVQLYGPTDVTDRGGTVAFNLLDPAGRVIPFARVEERARTAGVSLRGGCFCNPGASEAAFGFPADAAAACFRQNAGGDFSVDAFAACLGGDYAVGAVRISLGLANNLDDVRRAVDVIAAFRA